MPSTSRIAGALVIATGLILGGAALAQSGAALSPEQLQRVKEHVAKEKRDPATAPAGFTVTRGAALPQGLQAYAFPAEVGVPNYRYAVVGNQVLLIAADTNRIHEVWGIGY
jgi:hypothetical protein